MSRLIFETDDYVIIEEYIHHDNDSFYDWQLDNVGNLKYSEDFIQACDTSTYELLVRIRVDKHTNESEIVYIKDGDRKLT